MKPEKPRELAALLSLGGIMAELNVSRRTAERIMENLDKIMVPGVAKAFVKRADVHAFIEQHTIPADPRKRSAA